MSPIPMPPGYQATKPLVTEDERMAIRIAFGDAYSPPASWWRAHRETLVAILAAAKDGGRL